MALDVAGKVKIPVRLLDVPLLLELGGRLAIVCKVSERRLEACSGSQAGVMMHFGVGVPRTPFQQIPACRNVSEK